MSFTSAPSRRKEPSWQPSKGQTTFVEFGVTTIEIMPVRDFPGRRLLKA